jgi:hypothetical protein
MARVRTGLVHLTLDVPPDDVLLDWAATPNKPLAGQVVFLAAQGGSAVETLGWEAGQCVGYQEEFAAGDQGAGAYVCHLTIAAAKLTLQPGGPATYSSLAAGEHNNSTQAFLNTPPLLPPAAPLEELVLPTVEELAVTAGEKGLEALAAIGTVAALPIALTLALILGSATPASGPGIPQPHLPLADPNLLRLNALVAKQAAGTLTAEEETELLELLAKVKGIHVRSLAELPSILSPAIAKQPLQTITNKFPQESLPADGKVLPYTLVDGAIKGINGQRHVDFVIDPAGKLLIGNKHHTLGDRQAVQAAGQLRLNGRGQIRQIDNLSGHYQPTVAETVLYPALLQRAGLNVKGATLVTHHLSTNAEGIVTGIEVVSSKIIN